MTDRATLNTLRERVADAAAPTRQLFVEAWAACTGQPPPDATDRFDVLVAEEAWADAALLLAACALPDERLEVFWSAGGANTLSLVGESGVGRETGVAVAAGYSGRIGLSLLATVLDRLCDG